MKLKKRLLQWYLVLVFLTGVSVVIHAEEKTASSTGIYNLEHPKNALLAIRMEEYDLKFELSRVQLELTTVDKRWLANRKSLESSFAIKRSDSLWALKELLQVKKNSIERRLTHMAFFKAIIEGHKRLKTGDISQNKIKELKKKVIVFLSQLKEEMRFTSAKSEETKAEVQAIEKSLTTIPKNQQLQNWIKKKLEFVKQQEAVFKNLTLLLEKTEKVGKDYLKFADTMLKNYPIFNRFKEALGQLTNFWKFEIITIDQQTITIGKIILALVLFFLGVVLSRAFSAFIFKRIAVNWKSEPGTLAAFQKLFFYFLAGVILLLSLKVMEIPLTLFTLFGGALALGIGFGSQNIVNNFISGIIILGERPIKVGDYVEIDNELGVIERIGLRSTLVKSADNFHHVMPNSFFLEKNFINWTLSDRIVRAHVKLNISYSLPLKGIKQIVDETLKSFPKILEKPEPILFFAEFENTQISIKIYFWLSVTDLMDRKLIESGFRKKIEELAHKRLMNRAPVHPADFIEFDGKLGRIEYIGLRLTQVRTINNVSLILPNTYFFEKSFLNLSLNGNIVSCRVVVRALYGSPAEKVEQLIQDALKSFDFYEKEPEPLIVFSNFDDIGMEFKIIFWLKFNDLWDRPKAESKIRFKINELFTENGIKIPYRPLGIKDKKVKEKAKKAKENTIDTEETEDTEKELE
ncbi:mechanosensitive ion channel domain-containing protein [Candidatus Riflebacteria bacterium]